MTIPGQPLHHLKGGPYDGRVSAPDDQIRSVAHFPDRLVVVGEHGSTVYLLSDQRRDDGRRVAEFDHYG